MKRTEFDRTFYLKALVKRKHNGLVKIVTGIRRCGKSYLLTNLFKFVFNIYNYMRNVGIAGLGTYRVRLSVHFLYEKIQFPS